MAQAEAERLQCSCHGTGHIPLEAVKETWWCAVALFHTWVLRSSREKAVVRWPKKHIVMKSMCSQAVLMASSSSSQGNDGQE